MCLNMHQLLLKPLSRLTETFSAIHAQARMNAGLSGSSLQLQLHLRIQEKLVNSSF